MHVALYRIRFLEFSQLPDVILVPLIPYIWGLNCSVSLRIRCTFYSEELMVVVVKGFGHARYIFFEVLLLYPKIAFGGLMLPNLFRLKLNLIF